MPSDALLAHRFTPESSRAVIAKAVANRIAANKSRSLLRKLERAKTARRTISGTSVVALVATFNERLNQSHQELRAELESLKRPLSRADYRRAVLERTLGRATVEPPSRASKRHSPSPEPPPIRQSDEPTMVEPCWDRLLGAKL